MKKLYPYPSSYHCEYRIVYRDPLGLPMFVYTTEYYIRKAIKAGRISSSYRLIPSYDCQIFEFVDSSFYCLSPLLSY